MKIESIGETLLSDHQDLELLLAHSGQKGLLSLMAACVARGFNTERALRGKVQQIGGPYYDHAIPMLLERHSSAVAGPPLWQRDGADRFELVGPYNA